MKIKLWDGQLENTSLQVDFSSMEEIELASVDTDISSYDDSVKADKVDYLVAVSSGLLTAMLDVLWVGEFSLSYAQDIGTIQIENLVIAVAKSQGCIKDDIKGCISFLEKENLLTTDKLTSTFGGGKQHHLRDFSHHASPFGLICSILNQFTGKGYGTDTEGKIITPDIPDSEALGKTFEEKIFNGVIKWAFHLISDMAGSSGCTGKGTGIPGPLLSLAKVLSATPLFRDLQLKYKGDSIGFSKWVSKLFNGTFFEYKDYKDTIRFDFRTELGIANFAAKQSVPVLINQCIVRSFYFMRRFSEEYTKNNFTLTDFDKINFNKILPRKGRCIDRMITISTGVFTVVDGLDAIVRAKINNPNDNDNILSDTLLKLNFVGICTFVFSLKNEVKYKIHDIRMFFNKKTKDKLSLDDVKSIKNKGIYCGERFEDVHWYCDGCNSLLNSQKNFNDRCEIWFCSECGFKNIIEANKIDGYNEDNQNINNKQNGIIVTNLNINGRNNNHKGLKVAAGVTAGMTLVAGLLLSNKKK